METKLRFTDFLTMCYALGGIIMPAFEYKPKFFTLSVLGCPRFVYTKFPKLKQSCYSDSLLITPTYNDQYLTEIFPQLSAAHFSHMVCAKPLCRWLSHVER